jgi:hypothetical protein
MQNLIGGIKFLVEKKISEVLKIKTLILILIAGILFTSLTSTPLVNAQPTHTSLTIAVPSEPQWKEYTIEVTLKDENDNPLQNFNIDFYVCGSSKIGTAKTNSAGVASLKFTPSEDFYYPTPPPRTDTIKVNAVFSGTTNYAQSSSEDAYIEFIFRNIDVFLDYGSYIVSGGILAIIGIVGYIFFRRRKKSVS